MAGETPKNGQKFLRMVTWIVVIWFAIGLLDFIAVLIPMMKSR